MSDDFITNAAHELMNKIYGPKFCAHCERWCPVIVYELEGSRKHEMVGTEYKITFTGSKVCAVCYKAIDPMGESK